MREDLFYLRVIQEFSDAFLAQQDVAINRAALDRSLQLQTRVSTEFEGGRANRRELLRIQSLVQGDRAQLIAAEGAACISARRLIETVNPDDAGETRFEIDREGALSVPPPETGPGNIRLSLKRNEAAMYKEQIRFLRAGFFPSVDFIASINNQFMTIDTGGLAEQFIPRGVPDRDAVIGNLARQFDDANPKPGKYFDPDFFNYTVGLQLSWTIFNGFRTRAQYRQTKHLAEKSLLELEVMDREQDLAVEEARILLKTADSTIASVTTQLKAARMALSQTEKDYADGFSDFSTLLDTDKEYRDAVRALNGLTIQRLLALTQLRIALGLPVYGDTR